MWVSKSNPNHSDISFRDSLLQKIRYHSIQHRIPLDINVSFSFARPIDYLSIQHEIINCCNCYDNNHSDNNHSDHPIPDKLIIESKINDSIQPNKTNHFNQSNHDTKIVIYYSCLMQMATQDDRFYNCQGNVVDNTELRNLLYEYRNKNNNPIIMNFLLLSLFILLFYSLTVRNVSEIKMYYLFGTLFIILIIINLI